MYGEKEKTIKKGKVEVCIQVNRLVLPEAEILRDV